LWSDRQVTVMPPFFRGVLAGLLLPLAAGLPLAGFGLQYVPDSTFPGTLARILESAGPQLLLASVLPILALALVGARRLAGLCLLLAIGSGAALVAQRVATSAPLAADAPVDLRLLWFNADFRNPTPPAEIVAAIRASGADLVMLALSRYPLQDLQVISPGIAWDERMAVFDLTLPGRVPVSFVALHMTKPWFYGIVDDEIDTIEAALPRHPGPMVLAGDLNSAPWSLRLRWLRRVAHLEDPLVPIATWPAAAGGYGLPIDHVLVRGGPRIVSIAPWGAELGSDHRGLLAALSLPLAP
jgi:endonuclease/exonuclease/phosphatase (EEP) superfamily protein YafD